MLTRLERELWIRWRFWGFLVQNHGMSRKYALECKFVKYSRHCDSNCTNILVWRKADVAFRFKGMWSLVFVQMIVVMEKTLTGSNATLNFRFSLILVLLLCMCVGVLFSTLMSYFPFPLIVRLYWSLILETHRTFSFAAYLLWVLSNFLFFSFFFKKFQVNSLYSGEN